MGRTKSNPADRYFERNLIDRDYYVCQCNTDGDAEEQNSENVDNPDSISSSVSTSSTGTNISTSKICGAKVKVSIFATIKEIPNTIFPKIYQLSS